MAKKSVTARNEKRKRICSRFEKKRTTLKEALKNSMIEADGERVMELNLELQSLPRDSSKHRQVNRCSCCNRSKGVYKIFGLCRCCLRVLFSNGSIPGLRKASW
jgi:small subunit ribosomal protein S14